MSKEESDKRTGKEEATNSCVNLRVLSLATIRMMILSEEIIPTLSLKGAGDLILLV